MTISWGAVIPKYPRWAFALAATVAIACGLASANASADVWTLPGSQGIGHIAADFRAGDPGLVAIRNSGELVRVSLKTGAITVLAGDVQTGFANGDSMTARFDFPQAILVDPTGKIILADMGNHRIREFDPQTRQITTIAGTGKRGLADGDALTQATFSNPSGLAIASDRKIIIADSGNNRICELDRATNTVSTIANRSGEEGSVDGPIESARFRWPVALLVQAVQAGEKIFVTEHGNHVVRQLNRVTGTVSTIGESGWKGFANGNASQAAFDMPGGLAVDREGNLLIGDSQNGRLRLFSRATNMVSTFVGGERANGASRDGPNHEAWLSYPTDIVLGPAGSVFVADGSLRFVGPRDALEQTLSEAVRVGLGAVQAKDQMKLDQQRGILSEIIRKNSLEHLENMHRDLVTSHPNKPSYFALLPRELCTELSHFTAFDGLRAKMALARLPERID